KPQIQGVILMQVWKSGAVGLGLAILSGSALSHVGVASGPAFAGDRTIVDLSVPHGCDGMDTLRVEVDIPEQFTSVQPIDNVFGPATFETNSEGGISKIIWTKPVENALAADDHYYKLSFRATLPDAPFTVAALPTTQYCQTPDGNETFVSWDELPAEGGHDHHAAGSHPAPTLMIFPQRFPGWNQYVAPDHLHDMSIFDDAEIVWKNDVEAYSANPVTLQMIESDADVSVLGQIHPGETFWVKY
ncbi:MAG: DUF1775 domain-containing protein, partial [Ketobacter sp.]